MAYDGEHCPVCGAPMLYVADDVICSTSATTASREVKCSSPDCDRRFNEAFTLVALEEVDEDGRVVRDHMKKE